MATPQYMPTGRSLNALLGKRTLAQPAYNPDTAQQYQQGDTVYDNAPGTFGAKLQQLISPGSTPSGSTPKLEFGWAPKIGHITTTAATSKRRKTVNPLAAAPASTVGRKSNPFAIEQAPSADLFGLNLAV